MDIEGYAVAKVLESLSLTDHLVAHIALRDREPIWDGSVYVYKDTGNHKNENLKGRVPIQIKGELATNRKKFGSSVKYPIDVNNLKQYLTDGGAIFFVVRINKEQEKFQIYAEKLLPFTIKKLLPCSEEVKRVSVELSQFSTKETKKVNYFFNMLEDMKRQKSIIPLDHLQTLEELRQQASVERILITFTDVAVDKSNPYVYLMENKTFQYAELSGGMTIPIAELPPLDKLSSKSKAEISCAGQVFFDSFTREYTREKETLSIGKGISFIHATGAQTSSFNFSAEGTLHEAITDATFFCKFLENKVFYIDKTPVKLELAQDKHDDDLGQHISYLKKYINSLQYLENALHAVGFNEEITLSELSQDDEEAINSLVTSIIFRRSVSLKDAPDQTHCFVMNIAKYSIMLLAKRISENKFHLVNFFSKHIVIEFENDIDETLPPKAPGVIVLTTDNFLTLDNINYDTIYSEITTFTDVDNKYHSAVNQLLLRMLLAFDQKKNDKLLSCAMKIAKWLCATLGHGDDAIDTLNYFQVVKRQRDLTDSEKLKLTDIIINNPHDNALKTGVYIVLQDFPAAHKTFAQLSDTDQKGFSQWPIMNLWSEIKNPEQGDNDNG